MATSETSPHKEASHPPIRKAVTLRDIAKRLGLSHATVSRVLNNKGGGFISQATQRRVREAAASMGYRPNLAARHLKANRIGLAAVLGYPRFLEPGIYLHIMDAIVETLQARGMGILIDYAMGAMRTAGPPPFPFDGGIVFPGTKSHVAACLEEFGIPFVAVNSTRFPNRPRVIPDDAGGVRLALEHLASLGHARTAYFNNATDQHESVATRRKAYLEHGRPCDALAALSAIGLAAGEFLAGALAAGATAAICYDHLRCLQLHAAAKDAGVPIPERLSVVCFNDIFPVELTAPPTTTVRVPAFEMGEACARLLLASLDGEQVSCAPVVLPESLVIRGSTRPPARHA